MKSHVPAVLAAFAFMFVAAGAAFANQADKAHGLGPGRRGHAARVTGLVRLVGPEPRAWLEALRRVTGAPKPTPKPQAKRQARPKPQAARRPKPQPRAKRKPHVQPQARPTPKAKRTRTPVRPAARQPRHGTTSLYERTTKPWLLAKQGCSAARRHETGVAVLDFGQPAFKHHGYGTFLFSGRFASNDRITTAMLGYARGYASCLPRDSSAFITLARGTSNYHPSLPSAYEAGVRWARATNKLGVILRRQGLASHVEAAAADDAEPAWDPRFHKTRDFFHGFRTAVHGHDLYDYGSLDGGVGAIWSARQAWYVAGGIRHTKVLPEIYYAAMARQWAQLARIARRRFHRGVRFAGVMTQGSTGCGCGLRPGEAHRALAHALDSVGAGEIPLPRRGTNIVG